MPLCQKRVQPDAGTQGCSIKSFSCRMLKVAVKIAAIQKARLLVHIEIGSAISIDDKIAS